jgi:hypothetical protein
MKKSLLPLIVLVLINLILGCAGVSRQQLQLYTNAFDEAKSSSELIYAEMVSALKEGGGTEISKNESFTASLGPGVYSRIDCRPEIKVYEALLARCEAINMIANYNSAMMSLAQGSSGTMVLGRLDSAFNSAKTLVDMVPVPEVAAIFATAETIFPQIRAILSQALKLRDQAELKAKLNEGGPLIQNLIEAMQADVFEIYKVQRAYYQLRLEIIQNEIDSHVGEAKRIAFSFTAPTDASMIALRSILDARFDALFNQSEPTFGEERLSEVNGPAGNPTFSAEAAVNIGKSIDAVEIEVRNFREVVAKWNEFISALRSYDRLLESVDAAFKTLLTMSSDPFAPGGGVQQFIDTTFIVREQALEIKKKLAGK